MPQNTWSELFLRNQILIKLLPVNQNKPAEREEEEKSIQRKADESVWSSDTQKTSWLSFNVINQHLICSDVG